MQLLEQVCVEVFILTACRHSASASGACMGWCHVQLAFQHVVSSVHLVHESKTHAHWFVSHAGDKQSAQQKKTR